MEKKNERVKAPWNDDQLKNLNRFQKIGIMHPFTCCSPEEIHECERRSGKNDGLLTATTNGWVCPCGKYTQDWCYPGMLDVAALIEQYNQSEFGKHAPIKDEA